VIKLHRLGHAAEPFHLNPDLVSIVEAHPDTVVALTTGVKIVVLETPEEITQQIRDWRADILRDALGSRHHLRPV
jgi:flagellar protein FlbD